MPFSLRMSQEVFQTKMDQTFEGKWLDLPVARIELLVNQFFCNLQQPNFLQDKSNSWVVKRATPLLNSFCSN